MLRLPFKLAVMGTGIIGICLGIHGLYVFFTYSSFEAQMFILSGGVGATDREIDEYFSQFFLAIGMPAQLKPPILWMSCKGLQSWFVPAIIIGASIAACYLGNKIRARRMRLPRKLQKATRKLWYLGYRSIRQEEHKLHREGRKLRQEERKHGTMLDIVNIHRKQAKLQTLKAYHPLDTIARNHALYMAHKHKCNHDGFKDRAQRTAKYTESQYVAENCLMYPAHKYNHHIANKMINSWLQSPGHRDNLLNPEFSQTGIGWVLKNRHIYSCQIFSG